MAKKDAEDLPEDDAEGSGDGHTPIRIADHPRARHAIARTRAWGALIGFAAGMFFGHRAGLPFVDLVLRSIGIGIGGYLVAWAGGVGVWRQIIFAELALRRREANEAQKALLEELETAAREQSGQPPSPGMG